jgi:hypothetical protein
MRLLTRFVSVFAMAGLVVLPVRAQRVAKYGADFLAGGVGARALAMGGSQVALAGDVNAVYWNAAGLMALDYPEFAYMHAERFSGAVSFDYGAAAMPLTDRSTIAVAFFRSGVNDIKNTLDAWDSERDQPRANPDQFITSFSAVDYAIFVGYGRRVRQSISIGVTAKVIRRTIGSFASAWGYSFDASARYVGQNTRVGVTIQDLSTMLQSWSVDSAKLANIQDVFGDELPSGGTELVVPVVRLGFARVQPLSNAEMTVSADMDLAFDGRQANAFNMGNVSFHPRVGAEYAYRKVVALRAGLARIRNVRAKGLDITPTVGAGVAYRHFTIDYGFGDFAGLVSDLGFSHRISLSYRLERASSARPGSQ